MKQQHYTIFISAWSETPGEGGIRTYSISPDCQPHFHSSVELLCAGYLAFSPDRKILYSTCRANENSDAVAAFAIDQDGSLKQLGQIVESTGLSTCHLSVSPDGRFLYAANYFSGTFSEFSLAQDGSINALERVFCHTGSGPNKQRQEMAHPHCCVFSPDGRFLTVADLGNDTLFSYPYSPDRGIDFDHPVTSATAPGDGPRHILFDPEKELAYVIMELGNSVISYHFDNGRFTAADELYLLPRGVNCPTKASALRFSDDRSFLLCSNRGFDSLASIELDGSGGMFPAAITLSGGSSPRDINFIGKDFFAAANEFSDEVRFFDFDRSDGSLTPNGFELRMPRPLCIIQL